jgi:hypothetical protein
MKNWGEPKKISAIVEGSSEKNTLNGVKINYYTLNSSLGNKYAG